MSGAVSRFLGGSPGRVIFQLIAMCLVVGIILAMLGFSPNNLFSRLERLVANIYNMGFEAVEWAFEYLLLGAMVVLPIWLIMRLFRAGRSG